ncbi:Flagellar hook-length control protein FliK [Pseudogemmobacter humi]|uniref:Flagellar hook-length control protein FliK n=2 Tax=Pseudogemmobacter humi TaxID=2483812 RepID=A0A3P5WXX6_9RHOB|nr:Flagellar hook-length control protein FliK [Pseudogemmobacter humi]
MAALPQPARDNNRAVTVVPSVGGTAGDSTTVGDGETLKGAEPGSQDLPPGRPVPEAAPERTRSPVLAPGDGFSSAQALAVPADEAVFTAAIPPPATAHPDPALPPIANRPLPATLPVQIAHAAVSAEGPVTELRLSPEELGSVRIELVTEGEKVSVTILAERPETLDLMRRHADRLAAELRTAGFSQLDLGFGQGGAGETGSRAEAGGRIFHGNTADSPGPVPVAAPRPMAGSNLYLRL